MVLNRGDPQAPQPKTTYFRLLFWGFQRPWKRLRLHAQGYTHHLVCKLLGPKFGPRFLTGPRQVGL